MLPVLLKTIQRVQKAKKSFINMSKRKVIWPSQYLVCQSTTATHPAMNLMAVDRMYYVFCCLLFLEYKGQNKVIFYEAVYRKENMAIIVENLVCMSTNAIHPVINLLGVEGMYYVACSFFYYSLSTRAKIK